MYIPRHIIVALHASMMLLRLSFVLRLLFVLVAALAAHTRLSLARLLLLTYDTRLRLPYHR